MIKAMKKQLYISPESKILDLECASMLLISGGTKDYGSEPGEDDVEFDSRQGSWGGSAFESIDE